jgi:hypothetical protein
MESSGLPVAAMRNGTGDNRQFTPQELEVLLHLTNAWNGFVALPVMGNIADVQDQDTLHEFRRCIHVCQSLMAVRVAARCQPDLWRDGV